MQIENRGQIDLFSEQASLNSHIETNITNQVNHNITYRTLAGNADRHDKTSAYYLSNGYKQTLKEVEENSSKVISTSDNKIKIDITDTITFPKGQLYQDSDELYLRFVNNLRNTVDNKASAEQFPLGSNGTVEFYVYTGDGDSRTYYTYTKDSDGKESWTAVTGENSKVAASYNWTSDGGNMELPLAQKGEDGGAGEKISLQGIRKLTDNDNAGRTFKVQAVITVTIPAQRLNVIPADNTSNEDPKNFANLYYTAQLSTTEQGLSYSTTRANLQGECKYYQKDTQKVTLTYTADEIDQLGINLLDLQKGYLVGDYSVIDTTAKYDLAALKNMTETLKNAYGVQFTLTIVPKESETGKTESYPKTRDTNGAVINSDNSANLGEDAVQVVLSKSGSTVGYNLTKKAWIWTVQKDNEGNWPMNGTELVQQIQLKVKTKDVAKYANYKVELTAELYNKKTENDKEAQGDYVDKTRASDYIIYTVAKIPTEFVDKESATTTG